MQNLSLIEIEEIAFKALVGAGTSEINARPLAVATAATEVFGVASHGLAYIPIYCEHTREGKPIPREWALDRDGNPTTDPELASKDRWPCQVATKVLALV